MHQQKDRFEIKPLSRFGYRVHLLMIICLSFSLLQGCSRLGFPGVFKIDVTQGNIVTEDMLSLLEPGLDKQQVLYVMGSSLVDDLFNADRWDYVYYFKPGGEPMKKYQVVLYFDGDILADIDLRESELKQWHKKK